MAVNPDGQAGPPGRRPSKFGKQRRVLAATEFEVALKRRSVFRNSRFALHLGAARGDGVWRLGLVVPKRFEPTAVRRNAVKRAWREAFRQRAPQMSATPHAYDLIVRLCAPVQIETLVAFKRQCHADASSLLGVLVRRLARPEGD